MPPVLVGTDYDYWETRMTAFLRSMDSKTWKSIIKGWNPPTDKTTEGSSTTLTERKEEDWTKEEDEEALAN